LQDIYKFCTLYSFPFFDDIVKAKANLKRGRISDTNCIIDVACFQLWQVLVCRLDSINECRVVNRSRNLHSRGADRERGKRKSQRIWAMKRTCLKRTHSQLAHKKSCAFCLWLAFDKYLCTYYQHVCLSVSVCVCVFVCVRVKAHFIINLTTHNYATS